VKTIYTILVMLLILLVVTFSLENTVSVKLKYYDFFHIEWPAYMLIFISCLTGILFVGCMGIVERFRLSRTITHQNKTIRDLRKEIRTIQEKKINDEQKPEEAS